MPVTQELLQAIHEAADRARVEAESGGPPSNHSLVASTIRDLTQHLQAEDLFEAAEFSRDRPDVAAALLEQVIVKQPNNSRALVRLANCYWLLGTGPEPVAELASRAIGIDPQDRAAWHLWALSEKQPRERASRWQHVAERFPHDALALANFADNAASVAAAEKDYDMLDAAIGAYETLRERAHRDEERNAVERALSTLRGWRF